MKHNETVGLEWEFYSKIPLDQLFEKIERNLKIKLKFFNEGHSGFSPSNGVWKLERDYSGGSNMLELVSEPLPYEQAIDYMHKVFNLIKRNGYTTDKCAFQINISLNDKTLMNRVNKLKIALLLNEEGIFEDFPHRKGNMYCKSVKHFLPLTKHFNTLDKVNPSNFTIPESKYYGIDFTKLKKGYLEFRYFGGKGYEKNYDIYNAYINHFIQMLYKSTNNLFSPKELSLLNTYIKSKKLLLNAYKSYKNFKYAYPNIEIWVNLVNTTSFIETHYHMIKDKIFEIMSEANLKKGIINYNSDYSSIEIKDGEFENTYKLENAVLINCKGVTGDIINCRIFESTIANAHLMGCQVYQDTTIADSKLNDCYVSSGSSLINCYIASISNTIIIGKLTSCIFRSGKISRASYKNAIDTEFINYKFI